MISFNKKSIVLVGEHHKIHTPTSIKKYSYDMNLQYDIFYTLVELSNQFCTQLPLRYRPFPFFIEMSSDNEFLAYKRVNSKCINIAQSDMRCLSGTLMCRPHTSSARDHVLLSIQKKIFSADNFTTKNIQSILYELFFKIFKNNHDTMRDDDDSETDEISYTNFNSQYLEDFRKNINSNFSNKAHSFVTDYSEINAENFINYIRQDCLNEEIVRFGDKSCPFNSKARSDLY